MVPGSFDVFFKTATGFAPYPYQRRLSDDLDSLSLLRAPTGAGKTAGVILPWLWRRRFHLDPQVRRQTPRRLVYCLPIRVLVGQTRDCAATYEGRQCMREPRGGRRHAQERTRGRRAGVREWAGRRTTSSREGWRQYEYYSGCDYGGVFGPGAYHNAYFDLQAAWSSPASNAEINALIDRGIAGIRSRSRGIGEYNERCINYLNSARALLR